MDEGRLLSLVAEAENVPPVRWQAFADGMGPDERAAVTERLLGRAEWCLRLAAYLDARCSPGYGAPERGHAQAVKRSNTVGRAVRRLFGYFNTPDVRF